MTAKVASSPLLVQHLRAVCQALDDKKAEQLTVLHLGEESSLTEYFIIATGVANSHLRALRITVENTLEKLQVKVLGSESVPSSGWVVVDAVDFMVHLFLPEVRNIYRLEQLWRDARDVSSQILAAEPEPVLEKKAPEKTGARKTPVRRSAATSRRARCRKESAEQTPAQPPALSPESGPHAAPTRLVRKRKPPATS